MLSCIPRSCAARSRPLARLAADRRGSNAVEFALVAPVLLLILMGAVFVGLYIGTAHSLAQVAADTSRFAMPGRSETERRGRAEDWLRRSAGSYPLIDLSRITMTVAEADRLLVVSVSYDVSDLPLPALVRRAIPLPETIRQVSATAVP